MWGMHEATAIVHVTVGQGANGGNTGDCIKAVDLPPCQGLAGRVVKGMEIKIFKSQASILDMQPVLTGGGVHWRVEALHVRANIRIGKISKI
jgi:hypothetical protein